MVSSIIFGILCTGIVICTLILTETLKKNKLGDFLFSCFAITAMSIFAIQCPIFPWSAFNKINTNTTFDTYYLEAEPIAYNTDTTIFSTPNGYYTANAIYDEDTVYLLTMDDMGTNNIEDDEILVVWKCDEGSVG